MAGPRGYVPTKQDTFRTMLEAGPSVLVYFDARGEDVWVPARFKAMPQLILDIGYNMRPPIPDLEFGGDAITCTLSFNKQPFACRLPWRAIFMMQRKSTTDSRVWSEDVPPEVAAHRAPAPAPAPAPRPQLVAVPSPAASAPAPAAPRASGPQATPPEPVAAPDPRAGVVETRPEAEAPTEKGKAAGKGKAAEKGKAAGKGKGKAAAKKKKPQAPATEPPLAEPQAAVDLPPADEPQAAVEQRGAPAASASAPSSPQTARGQMKPKRELPSYLRVIK